MLHSKKQKVSLTVCMFFVFFILTGYSYAQTINIGISHSESGATPTGLQGIITMNLNNIHVIRDGNIFDVAFNGSATSRNDMNNTSPVGCENQAVTLEITTVNNTTKWERFISHYTVYPANHIHLFHANNYNHSYTRRYTNNSGSPKTVTVDIKMYAVACLAPAGPVVEHTIIWNSGTHGHSWTVPSQACPAALNLNTTSLDFGAGSAAQQNKNLTITNTGGGTLGWEAEPSENWITLSKTEGTSPYNMNVTVTRGDIPRQERNVKNHTGTIDFSGNGGTPSVTVSADLAAPSAPQNLTISHAGTLSNPQLNWSESALYYKYHIERNAAGTGWNVIDSTDAAPYIDTAVDVDTQWGDDIQYRVRARNGAGFSGYSNTASVSGHTPLRIDTTDDLFAAVLAEALPEDYALDHCYPNPGNPGTSVRFQLPEEGQVDIRIYNIRGETVRTLFTGQKQAGFHRIDWDGRTNAGAIAGTGLYIIVLHAGGRTFNTKYTLIK